jgi:putative MFS transporter
MVWRPPYLVRTLAMICGAVSTFSMFYLGVNHVPSLFLEKQMGMTNALLFTLIITSVQIPGKILNGLVAERVGRKAVYLIYTIPAAIGAYEFGQSWSLPFDRTRHGVRSQTRRCASSRSSC